MRTLVRPNVLWQNELNVLHPLYFVCFISYERCIVLKITPRDFTQMYKVINILWHLFSCVLLSCRSGHLHLVKGGGAPREWGKYHAPKDTWRQRRQSIVQKRFVKVVFYIKLKQFQQKGGLLENKHPKIIIIIFENCLEFERRRDSSEWKRFKS